MLIGCTIEDPDLGTGTVVGYSRDTGYCSVSFPTGTVLLHEDELPSLELPRAVKLYVILGVLVWVGTAALLLNWALS